MGSVEYLGHRFSINHPGALANPKVSNTGPLLEELKNWNNSNQCHNGV